MRMKRSRVKTYHHKKAVAKKDGEGNAYIEYGPATEVMAEMWPASGKAQAEMYGNRLSYIRNVRIDGKYSIVSDEKGIQHYVLENKTDIVEGDGMCLYVSGEMLPDYKILSIKPLRYLRLEVEKIDHRV